MSPRICGPATALLALAALAVLAAGCGESPPASQAPETSPEAAAVSSPEAAASPAAEATATYENLLAAAKRDPDAADFTALRLAAARSSGPGPDALDRGELASLERAVEEEGWLAAIGSIDRLLAASYLDIETHATAVIVYERAGDKERADRHGRFMKGLLESIVDSGEGHSFETAFAVTCVREEYAILSALGFEPRGQALIEHEGHLYDVLDVSDPETGETGRVYFNADVYMRRLRREIGGAKEEGNGGEADVEAPDADGGEEGPE